MKFKPTEYDYFIRHLAAEDLVAFDIDKAADEDEVDSIYNCRLTAKGHLLADELSTKRAASMQGFIAMSFDPSLSIAWRDGIEPGRPWIVGCRATRVVSLKAAPAILQHIVM